MSPTIPHENTDETARTTDAQPPIHALLNAVGLAPLPATGWIKVTGPDRVRWLNGMVTNSVQDLTPGAGNYNLILNAQGRTQGDAYVFAQPDHLLLQTGLAHVASLITLLDRFIIMDDVELEDISAESSGIVLAGPHAPNLLRSLDLNLRADPAPPALATLPWRGRPLTVVRAFSPLVPRIEIWADEATLAELSSAALAHSATPCTPADLDLLRILEGTPLFGVDIRDRDLPQETGASRALHFAKGCYLGQEIVERIRSRGNVHRTFGGFRLDGAPAAPGLALTVDDKPVGELTSVAVLPAADGHTEARIGLGYIRREALAQGKAIHFEGGTARPAALPFEQAKIL